MRPLLVLAAALALSACSTAPSTYVAENHSGCAMTSARENAACVHAAGVKRAAAIEVASTN